MEGKKLLKYLRSNGITQRQLATELDITPQAVSYQLKRERFSAEFLKKLEDLYGKGFLNKFTIANNQVAKENYSPYTIVSPALADEVSFKKETFNKIPHFERADAMIRISGDSMKGKINNGDYAIIRRIHDVSRIIYGEIYYLVTKANKLKTVKYINKHEKSDNLLWLVPYNKELFQPQVIEKNDILELYNVKGGICIY